MREISHANVYMVYQNNNAYAPTLELLKKNWDKNFKNVFPHVLP